MIEKAVVTGASGFVGRVLCRELEKRGASVTGIARAAGPFEGYQGTWVSADLAAEAPSIASGVSAFFHLAGKAHAIAETKGNDSGYRHANVDGTHHALDAAATAGASVFVYFSSVKVFGSPQQRSDRGLTEEDMPEPDTPYGRSKLEAERLVLAEARIARRVVIRPALVYGPGVKGNLARMREAIARGRFPPVRETGNRRSLVHVDDLVSAALLAAEVSHAGGRIYHIADGETYSTRRLYVAMCAASGRAPANWTTSGFALRAAALAGDAAGALLGRRAPFDTPALRRLCESAWFAADRARDELRWKPLNTVESWCTTVKAG